MQDLNKLQSQLEQKRQELARLEAELVQARREKLAKIAPENGFGSTDELILALFDLLTPEMMANLTKKHELSSPPESRSAYHRGQKGRKKRAFINDGIRQQIIAELTRNAMNAADIAAKFGVSVSAVNQLKRRHGLTKRRKVVSASSE